MPDTLPHVRGARIRVTYIPISWHFAGGFASQGARESPSSPAEPSIDSSADPSTLTPSIISGSNRGAPRRLPRSTTTSRRRHQQMPSAPGMLALAQAGRFQHPPDGMHYDAPTDCRIDDPYGFDGAPLYLRATSVVGRGPAPWLGRT
jgi:hypothetical protein